MYSVNILTSISLLLRLLTVSKYVSQLGNQVGVYWNQSHCQDIAFRTHLRGCLGGGRPSQDMATQQDACVASLNAWRGRRIQSLQRDAALSWG